MTLQEQIDFLEDQAARLGAWEKRLQERKARIEERRMAALPPDATRAALHAAWAALGGSDGFLFGNAEIENSATMPVNRIEFPKRP
jgi:hypothetical protein